MDINESSIQNLALNGDLAEVEARLHGDPHVAASVDGDSRTPLHWACVSGSTPIFRLLLSLPPQEQEATAQQIEGLDRETGYGNYHINVNAQDDGGWVRTHIHTHTLSTPWRASASSSVDIA